MGFHQAFMSKLHEFSESWRQQALKEDRRINKWLLAFFFFNFFFPHSWTKRLVSMKNCSTTSLPSWVSVSSPSSWSRDQRRYSIPVDLAGHRSGQWFHKSGVGVVLRISEIETRQKSYHPRHTVHFGEAHENANQYGGSRERATTKMKDYFILKNF